MWLRRLLTRAPVWVVLFASGCARNAFLELEIELPKNERTATIGDRFAVVRVATPDTPFESIWEGNNPIPATKLSSVAPTTLRVSVEGDSDSETKAVRLKARFCKNTSCTEQNDDNAPEVWLELERVFYIGKRTTYRWKIDCIPTLAGEPPAMPACVETNKTQTTVAKCTVGGCRAGTASSNHCVGGKHFCEE